MIPGDGVRRLTKFNRDKNRSKSLECASIPAHRGGRETKSIPGMVASLYLARYHTILKIGFVVLLAC